MAAASPPGGGRPRSAMPGSGLSDRQLEDLRSAFSLFDKDASGSIDVDELRACLCTLGRFPSPVELEELMQQMDTDGNGTIDFQEFVAAMEEHQENEELEAEIEEMKAVFMLLDKDGNGVLDAGELRRAMKILGIDLTPEETQVLMDEIDADKSGEVSFDEFANYILEFREEEEEAHHK